MGADVHAVFSQVENETILAKMIWSCVPVCYHKLKSCSDLTGREYFAWFVSDFFFPRMIFIVFALNMCDMSYMMKLH